MQRSDNSAAQVNRAGQKRRVSRVFRVDDAQAGEQKSDDDRRENLEKSFDPEMHDPPAPVFDDRNMRFHSPEKSGAVKKRDSRRRQQIKQDERFAVALAFQTRNRRPRDQKQPEQ